jgi:two-component sensor histidine kinase
MQSWFPFEPGIIVLVQVLLTFLIVISLGLFRFASGTRYKSWSIGWTIYTIAAVSTVFSVESGLVMSDAITTAGMMVGTMALIDGSNEKSRQGKELVIYPVLALIGFILVPIGIFLNLVYGFIFTPIGFFTTYACWLSVVKLRASLRTKNIDYHSLIAGLSLWGFSTLLFPINIWVEIIDIQVIVITAGLTITGAAMLTFLFETKTEDLRTQYAISQLMSGILNHDMRNYVGSLSESVEQALIPDSDREFWLELMSEITQSMTGFIADIRQITSSLSRFELESKPIQLRPILDEVKTRVEREYDLDPTQINIDILDEEMVMTSGIVRELLWNIMDNAFKQNSHTLEISAIESKKKLLVLEISDDAGGMRKTMYDFLNDVNALNSPAAPGTGLGLILICGLSQLCKVSLNVRDCIKESKVVGTTFTLQFDRANSTEAVRPEAKQTLVQR